MGQLGWVVLAAVLAAPLAFFALVTPREETAQEPPALAAPPSKLAAFGLRENRDWDGLPDIFNVWAPRAHWQGDRTRFAYWNPGTQEHSYFFEARRSAQGLRFREIKEPRDPRFEWDPDARPDDPLRLYLPKRSALPARPPTESDRPTPERPAPVKVEVQVVPAPAEPPAPRQP